MLSVDSLLTKPDALFALWLLLLLLLAQPLQLFEDLLRSLDPVRICWIGTGR
jgi:hypothetical protein